MLSYFPKYFSNKAIAVFLLSVIAVFIIFNNASMPLYLYVYGIGAVILFFYGSNSLTKQWSKISTKTFENKLLWTAFIIRLLYVLIAYNMNYYLYGTYYESNAGDINWYVPTAFEGAQYIADGQNILKIWNSWGILYDDMGYILYLAIIYFFTGSISEVIIPLIIKAFLGAYICVCMYRVATRHFDEATGRMAGIFCALQFNMIWWCGSMMKEAEMCFLLAWFVDRADNILCGRNNNVMYWIITLLVALSLYFFRTILSICAIMSFFVAVLFVKNRIFTKKRKISLIVICSLLLLSTMGGKIYNEMNTLLERASSDHQQTNMEWRTRRVGGNEFAKYAGAAVFAPLIFTIPFPTVVYTQQDQEMQMQVGGGNYVKNIMSFFVIIFMFYMLKNKTWKNHIFLIAVLLSYLLALVFSEFAQSGRFHMPIMGLEMLFAAAGVVYYGKSNKKLFNYFLLFEFVIIIGWSWFKLAGRGLA